MFSREKIRELLTYPGRDVLSLYVDVDPTRPENARANPAYRVWAKTALRDLVRSFAEILPKDEHKELEERAERLVERVELLRSGGRTYVLFQGRDWEEECTCQARLRENFVHYGAPAVVPLLWLLEEYARAGIVLVDHHQARFLTVQLGLTESVDEEFLYIDTSEFPEYDVRSTPILEAHGARVVKGSFSDVFDRRVDAHVERFWRDVAERLERFVAKEAPVFVLLGGEERARSFLLEALHPKTRTKVLAENPGIGVGAPERDILLAAKSILERAEREHEYRLVERALEELHKNGRADAGRENVLNAVRLGRAHTVLAAWPIAGNIRVCPSCGTYFDAELAQLAACPYCGTALVERSFATLLLREAYLHDTEVELVTGRAAERLAPYGGVAVTLRYS
ncbi:MAG: hypothetical protein KM296_05195 [Brockia lithotrophica]|nr:hypothetical protein [Brockia lithotrophica]